MRCWEVRQETAVAKMETTKTGRDLASKVKNNFFS